MGLIDALVLRWNLVRRCQWAYLSLFRRAGIAQILPCFEGEFSEIYWKCSWNTLIHREAYSGVTGKSAQLDYTKLKHDYSEVIRLRYYNFYRVFILGEINMYAIQLKLQQLIFPFCAKIRGTDMGVKKMDEFQYQKTSNILSWCELKRSYQIQRQGIRWKSALAKLLRNPG